MWVQYHGNAILSIIFIEILIVNKSPHFFAGIETVAGLASAKSDQIENILYSAEPFKSKKKDDAHQQQANFLSKNPCNIYSTFLLNKHKLFIFKLE